MHQTRRWSRLFPFLAVLVLSLAAVPASADRWQPLPLWGGDARLVAAAGDPSVVYAGTRRAGLFRSTNAGRTWQFVGPGPNLLPTEFIDVDPHDADRLYLRAYDSRAAVWSFYRSEDGGRSWQRSDAGLPSNASVRELAFDPQTPSVVYAATTGLYRSRNGGVSWRPLGLAGRAVIHLGVSPSDPDVLLASASSDEGWTTQRSTDGGRTFTKVMNEYLETFVFDPAHPQRVYGSRFNTFYRSNDLGATWTQREAADTILSLILTRSGVLLAGGFAGVRRSLDGGITWEPPAGQHAPPPDAIRSLVELENWTLAGGFRNIWRSLTEGRGWRPSSTGFRGHWVDTLEAAGGTLWLSTEAGLFKSGDEGASFQSLLSGLGPYNPGSRVKLLAADPLQPEVAYVFGCCAELSDLPNDFGLLKTEDGGATWRRLPYTDILWDFAVLEVNPGNPGILYAGGFLVPHGSPCTAQRSIDGGETWECMPVLGSQDFSALAISSRNPRILYAVAGEKLYRSADQGASWSQVPTTRTELQRIEVDPFRSERLYALADHELLRSDDGGRTWSRKLAVPQPALFRDLLLDPVRRDRIWATADTFHPGDAISESSRIFRSDDAGGHWTEVTAGLKPGTVVLDLAVDPDGGDVIYAGTAGRGLFRLID
jgi:photosystem II stability/assembly factor-like uncharacterized protein